MKTDVYDNKAKKVGTVELSDRLFGRLWNSDLVHQALRAQTANRRQKLAHTKDRSEVRGGGRKPWQQKGLGRARHGSIRSPIWKGGGVTFGPTKEKNFTKRINKKMRQGAIFTVLSKRLEEGEIKVVDSLEISTPRTKELTDIIKNFTDSQSVLLVPSVKNKNLYQASRNLKNIKSLDSRSLNVYDALRFKSILVEKDALVEIEKHYHIIK